jgi:transposase IS66 family protein
MLDDLELDQIQDLDQARTAIHRLLNLVEELAAESQALRSEVQRLRDEVNHLKGEQGRPHIQGNRPRPTNCSSEPERHKPQTWTKTRKVPHLRIDRKEVLKVDPTRLPSDAQFKGHVPVVVQEIRFETETIEFLKEKYYSPATQRTYVAELPAGYRGQFGPHLRALAVTLYFGANLSEPKLLEFFHQAGIALSAGQLSNLLVQDQDTFHAEKQAVYVSGLESSAWQVSDHTSTRVDGQNQACQIVCNPLYTAFFTTPKQDRLSVLEVFQPGRTLSFRFNAETQHLLEIFNLPLWVRERVTHFPTDQDLSRERLEALLAETCPGLTDPAQARLLDAAALAAYHAQTEVPPVRLLVCDEAGQFNWVSSEVALCWVHEGRHYKKLEPTWKAHRTLRDDFLKEFWAFYDQLLGYRQQPTPAERQRLDQEFDRLFATVTHYEALDARIAKTRAKKQELLRVLAHPEIPLHSNAAELGARLRVRKRDVSFGPRTAAGTQAWDTFQTLAATTKKLGLSFYDYVRDRILGTNHVCQLASLIRERAQQHPLDLSWAVPASTPSY